MIAGGSQTLLCAVLFWGGATLAEAASPLALTNVEKSGEDYVLAAGPNVEGVVLLKQGRWSLEELRAFHEVPWIDAASVRVRWAELEPQDQHFDFTIAERWSAWHDADRVGELPPSTEAEVQVKLHTDDGYVSPRLQWISMEWKS